MKKILVVFGTRPEAIKMAPVVKALQARASDFATEVCVTAQHRHMLDQVLTFFEIVPDYDLDLMKRQPDLFRLTSDVLLGMKDVLDSSQPDCVLVHGDTTTSTAVALAAFYRKILVGHIEAGLRTYDPYAPFPEEINRQLTGRLAHSHFAPTSGAKANLLREGVPENQVVVTGNTVIDALYWAKNRLMDYQDNEISELMKSIDLDKRLILVTAHRRENHGQGLLAICHALSQLAARDDVQIVFPLHLNPQVKGPVEEQLGGIANIHLFEPLGYPAFTWLLMQSYLVITDSGGIQEEAPGLGKPVLVLRDVSERPEAIDAGMVKLVGTDRDRIISSTTALLDDPTQYEAMRHGKNPYGDGRSADRIVDYLLNS